MCLLVALAQAQDTQEECDPGQNGSDCSSFPYEVCDDALKICVHKGILPLEPLEIICYILVPILLAVSTIGGIGGGIIMVPLLIGFFKFKTKEAIGITSALVFEAAATRFFAFSMHQKHPDRPEATVIDYKLVRAIFALFLVGSYFGVLLSVTLGELILAVILAFMLVLLAIQTTYKAVKIYQKESAQKKQAALKEADAAPTERAL